MHDLHTRESRGFGFVTMETPEEADAAVAALQGTELGGKLIKVEKARRERARTPASGRYYGPPKRGGLLLIFCFIFSPCRVVHSRDLMLVFATLVDEGLE